MFLRYTRDSIGSQTELSRASRACSAPWRGLTTGVARVLRLAVRVHCTVVRLLRLAKRLRRGVVDPLCGLVRPLHGAVRRLRGPVVLIPARAN